MVLLPTNHERYDPAYRAAGSVGHFRNSADWYRLILICSVGSPGNRAGSRVMVSLRFTPSRTVRTAFGKQSHFRVQVRFSENQSFQTLI